MPLPLAVSLSVPSLLNYKEANTLWVFMLISLVDVVAVAPQEGNRWLFGRMLMIECRDGGFWLDVKLLDSEGEAVCLAKHLCVARPFAKEHKHNPRRNKL